MSFILDALRKSEHERQRQSTPGITDLRPAAAQPRLPLWAIALGTLLVANIAVVAVLVMRNDPVHSRDDSATSVPANPPVQQPGAIATSTQPATPTPARETLGVPASVFATEGLNVPSAPAEAVIGNADTVARGSSPAAGVSEEEPEILEPLPTIDEMAARGTVLPELHLDIHVYVKRSAGRFVFINQRKYREGARLPEGPLIEQITREGVVLSYGGSRFLMPRP